MGMLLLEPHLHAVLLVLPVDDQVLDPLGGLAAEPGPLHALSGLGLEQSILCRCQLNHELPQLKHRDHAAAGVVKALAGKASGWWSPGSWAGL